MSHRLALGTAQFGFEYGIANELGQVSTREVSVILKEARTLGIDLLDTAIDYGNSERVIGLARSQSWKIVTKLPPVPDDCSNVALWVHDQINGSLERLGIDRLYGLLLHKPDQIFGPRGNSILHAINQLEKDGLVQKIGVSVYAPEELTPLLDRMEIKLVQIPLNILDQRLDRSSWAEKLKKQGVELHVRSVFLQGLLLMPASQRPEKFSRWLPLWSIWDKWLSDTGVSALQACLRYALSVDGVDKVVVGVNNVDQIREILIASQGSLDSLPPWPQPLDLDLINPAFWHRL